MNARGMILIHRIVGIFVAVVALIPGGFGVWSYISTRTFLRQAVNTTGIIEELRPVSGENGRTTYQPIFSFVDASGSKHKIVPMSSSNPPGYYVGEQVAVLYVPNHPNDARLNTFGELWLYPIIFTVVMFVGFLAAATLIWFVPLVISQLFPSPIQPA